MRSGLQLKLASYLAASLLTALLIGWKAAKPGVGWWLVSPWSDDPITIDAPQLARYL
jgi:hypothetical protein